MGEQITAKIRHARPCAGHPRLQHYEESKDGDGRDKPGHDEQEALFSS
jgi:hypothetical protein